MDMTISIKDIPVKSKMYIMKIWIAEMDIFVYCRNRTQKIEEGTGMGFTERLRAFREQTGLNQKEFAEQADIPQLIYNRIETGKRQPDINNLIAIRKRYGLNLNELLMGENLDSARRGVPLFMQKDLLVPTEQRTTQQWIVHPDLPEDSYAIRVTDNSNYPLLSLNDVVFIHGDSAEVGDLVLCRDKTQNIIIRRLVCRNRTTEQVSEESYSGYSFVAENPEYGSIAFEGIDIIGRVVAFVKVTNMKR
jgi:transcriptional regulator with XRE-family HTH domain